MRRAGKVDANQPAIVKALRRVGAYVGIVSGVSNLGYDIVVTYSGVNYLVEIKDGDKPPSARKLTQSEVKARFEVTSRNAPYHVINSVDEALQMIGITPTPRE